ncbi:MAG TPA: class I SAM-dependent methyltransferase [Pirellulaceae bacterium]|nr:class I SAM-dependent methyltransferase [Pirellulaceae bacterium]
MLFNNPISGEKADRMVRLIELQPESHVLDVGCGTGELLLRIVGQHRARGVGVDVSPQCITAARKAAAERSLAERCEFHEFNVRDVELCRNTFDLGICVGATHAFGPGEAAYPNSISWLRQMVRPGGYVLIGEGYWKRSPDAEYLQRLGDPVGIYRDHAQNVSFAEQCGLEALYAVTSSDDEWDEFEWSHYQQSRRAAEASPDDQQLVARLARSIRWRDGYLRWGRSTMGFGLYLFRVPRESVSAEVK